jgi:hypothetical protein
LFKKQKSQERREMADPNVQPLPDPQPLITQIEKTYSKQKLGKGRWFLNGLGSYIDIQIRYMRSKNDDPSKIQAIAEKVKNNAAVLRWFADDLELLQKVVNTLASETTNKTILEKAVYYTHDAPLKTAIVQVAYNILSPQLQSAQQSSIAVAVTETPIPNKFTTWSPEHPWGVFWYNNAAPAECYGFFEKEAAAVDMSTKKMRETHHNYTVKNVPEKEPIETTTSKEDRLAVLNGQQRRASTEYPYGVDCQCSQPSDSSLPGSYYCGFFNTRELAETAKRLFSANAPADLGVTDFRVIRIEQSWTPVMFLHCAPWIKPLKEYTSEK